MFIAKENLHKIRKNGCYGAPDVIIEILFPSTKKYDRTEKMEIYEHYGVKEYWMIEPDSKMAEGFLLKKEKFIPLEKVRGKVFIDSLKLNEAI